MKQLRLGGHLKVDQGLALVVATARGMDYNEVQIYVGDPKDYTPYEFSAEDAAEYRKMSYGISTTVHLPFVINPCEDNGRRKSFYKMSLKNHIEASQALGATKLVLHPGFKKELTEEQAKLNACRFLESVWEDEYNLELLLETDSGSKNGSAIGTPAFIQEVLEAVDIPKLGMCLDTTHMYARGVDLWQKEIRKEFLDTYGRLLRLVHLNVPDVEVKLGSFLDRHNTAFIDRKEWNHQGFLEDMAAYPMILERRSLQVQQQDNIYVRQVLGQPLEKQKA